MCGLHEVGRHGVGTLLGAVWLDHLGAPAHLARLTHTLLHRLEGALGGLVAGLEEALDGLLSRGMLLAAHNAPRLGLHEILLCQATAGVLGRSVEYLGLGAGCDLMVCHGVYWILGKKGAGDLRKKLKPGQGRREGC